MSALNFRPATRDDLPTIIALLADDDDEHSSGREDPTLPLDSRYLAAFETIHADPNQEVIVADQDGRVIGVMQLSYLPGLAFRGAWRGMIEAVRVARDVRGQRVGARMIGEANNRFRARGCRMAQLMSQQSRTDAHRFYERLGWDKSHFGFKYQLEKP
jgi:GNAT superfamily N-acetyltransferase